jgi:hypothetical protein
MKRPLFATTVAELPVSDATALAVFEVLSLLEFLSI